MASRVSERRVGLALATFASQTPPTEKLSASSFEQIIKFINRAGRIEYFRNPKLAVGWEVAVSPSLDKAREEAYHRMSYATWGTATPFNSSASPEENPFPYMAGPISGRNWEDFASGHSMDMSIFGVQQKTGRLGSDLPLLNEASEVLSLVVTKRVLDCLSLPPSERHHHQYISDAIFDARRKLELIALDDLEFPNKSKINEYADARQRIWEENGVGLIGMARKTTFVYTSEDLLRHASRSAQIQTA